MTQRNHKSSSARGGNMVAVGSYMYHSTHQITQQSTFWHNTVGGSGFSGFRLFWNNNANFVAIGTTALYALKP